MINVVRKNIVKKIIIILIGLLSCATFSGCSNNNTKWTKPYVQANRQEINKFNLAQNIPKYEIDSHQLGIIFAKDFRDNGKIDDSDQSSYFKINNDSHNVYFTVGESEPINHKYSRDVRSLHSKIYEHTITFNQGKKNVTYKLYNLKKRGKSFGFPKGAKEIVLIPIKERILGKHEMSISKKQGKHYLAYLKETVKLNHTQRTNKELPTD